MTLGKVLCLSKPSFSDTVAEPQARSEYANGNLLFFFLDLTIKLFYFIAFYTLINFSLFCMVSILQE